MRSRLEKEEEKALNPCKSALCKASALLRSSIIFSDVTVLLVLGRLSKSAYGLMRLYQGGPRGHTPCSCLELASLQEDMDVLRQIDLKSAILVYIRRDISALPVFFCSACRTSLVCFLYI